MYVLLVQSGFNKNVMFYLIYIQVTSRYTSASQVDSALVVSQSVNYCFDNYLEFK